MESHERHLSVKNTLSHRHGWLAPTATVFVLFTTLTSLLVPAPLHVQALTNLEPGQISVETAPYSKDQILGKWSLYDGILRKSENRSDGTATLNITFDFVASFIYGSKLSMETDWTLEGDVLTYTVTGGAPEASLKRLTNDFGSVASYRILRLDEKEMLLLELDGSDDLYLWKRES